MYLQDVAERSSSPLNSEALQPQHNLSLSDLYLFGRDWAMFHAGNPKITHTSQWGQAGQLCPVPTFETYRRLRCQKASHPFWHWASLCLWLAADRKLPKKTTLLFNQSRSRLSQFILENISNLGYGHVTQEQAAGRPVSVCPRPKIQGCRPC